MKTWNANLYLQVENELGECPEWSPIDQRLSWVDILSKRFHYLDFFANHHDWIDVDDLLCFAIPTTQKNLYITGQGCELRILNLETKKSKSLKAISENKLLNRFNDAKCDKRGRLFVGTTTNDLKTSPANLYKIEDDLNTFLVLGGVGCSNGLCWNHDSTKMFYIDTIALNLRSFDYDLESGGISNETVLYEYPKNKGYLDGMTIDAEDKLWISIWAGSKVIRFCPIHKKVIGEVLVNAKQPTSVVFAGDNLEMLFITSARAGLEKSLVQKNPEEGSLFCVETGIKGSMNNPFKYKGE